MSTCTYQTQIIVTTQLSKSILCYYSSPKPKI